MAAVVLQSGQDVHVAEIPQMDRGVGPSGTHSKMLAGGKRVSNLIRVVTRDGGLDGLPVSVEGEGSRKTDSFQLKDRIPACDIGAISSGPSPDIPTETGYSNGPSKEPSQRLSGPDHNSVPPQVMGRACGVSPDDPGANQNTTSTSLENPIDASCEPGPSNPYHRRSVRLEDSRTSFVDVSTEITEMSEYPVSEGGFCDVHLAQMAGEGKVALKKLRLLGSLEKAKKRFRYEAEIWIKLDHPNVLRFFGICQRGPTMYMVSPWQENGHMTAFFKSNPEVDRIRFLCQVADALAYLHSNDPKIIHGDIKGQNILVSQGGGALLCDFGLSMILDEIAILSGVPTGVHDGGSVRWLAPEMMQGEQPKTELSDVYSFSMVVVEAFTCSPPFPELRGDAAVINAINSGERPRRPFRMSSEISHERLWRLIQVCWHPDMQYRPSMRNVHNLMSQIARGDADLHNPLFDAELSALCDYVMHNTSSLSEYITAGTTSQARPNVLSLPIKRKKMFTIAVHYPRIRQRQKMQVLLLLHISILMLSVCQVGLCSVLTTQLLKSKTSDAIYRHVLPALGLATSGYLSVLQPYFIWIFAYFVFPGVKSPIFLRWLPWRLNRFMLDVIPPLLSVADVVLLSVIAFSDRFQHPSGGRFLRFLYAHYGLTILTCLLVLSMIVVRHGFIGYEPDNENRTRAPISTIAFPPPQQAPGKKRTGSYHDKPDSPVVKAEAGLPWDPKDDAVISDGHAKEARDTETNHSFATSIAEAAAVTGVAQSEEDAREFTERGPTHDTRPSRERRLSGLSARQREKQRARD